MSELTEADIMIGGPAPQPEPDPEPAPDPTPEPTPDPDQALLDKISNLEGQVAVLSKPEPKPEPEVKKKAIETVMESLEAEDFETQFYANPKGMMKTLMSSMFDAVQQEMSGELEKTQSSLTQRYTADQAQKDFWKQFYKDHKDLKDDKELVKMIANQHAGDMKAMADRGDHAGMRTYIADKTRETIARYVKNNNNGGQPQPEVVEDANSGLDASAKDGKESSEKGRQTDKQVITFSQILANKRKARNAKPAKAGAST